VEDGYVVNVYALEEYPDFTIRKGRPVSEKVTYLGNKNIRVV
jgi:ribosomal protein L5